MSEADSINTRGDGTELGMVRDVRTHNGHPWMHYALPNGAHAYMRYTVRGVSNKGGLWEIEFTNAQGHPLSDVPLRSIAQGNRHFHADRTQALVHIREVYDLEAMIPGDYIGYRLTVDQAAKVHKPDAGTRFCLRFDNMTEAEARGCLDYLRTNGSQRIVRGETP